MPHIFKIKTIVRMFVHFDLFIVRKFYCPSCTIRRFIFMVNHDYPSKNYRKIYGGNLVITSNCNSLLSGQLDATDQSGIPHENGILLFYCYFFSSLLVWYHIKRPVLYLLDLSERQKWFVSLITSSYFRDKELSTIIIRLNGKSYNIK